MASTDVAKAVALIEIGTKMISGPMFCSQMRVDFVLIPSTAGKGYIAAEENKMNNLILLPLSSMVEAQ